MKLSPTMICTRAKYLFVKHRTAVPKPYVMDMASMEDTQSRRREERADVLANLKNGWNSLEG